MTFEIAEVRKLANDLLRPERFRTAGITLQATQGEVTLPWEIFQGRLLDEAHTRQKQTFESWNIHLIQDGQTAPVPLLSLLLDAEATQLHVVRCIESHVWEGYDSGGGVYLSRERQKWLRELIATFQLDNVAHLAEELSTAIHRAIVGAKLPLTPVETPMPAFSFGHLHYPRPDSRSRDLEFLLRSHSTPSIPDLTEPWRTSAEFLDDLRRVFLDVSLSPWSDFVDRVLGSLHTLERSSFISQAEILHFESWLLRLVSRHLTAYDLVLFHHRGANYPDALLLDSVLSDFLTRMETLESTPTRLHRRALRQAFCLRRVYEGHLVPDFPTSPGEHMRVYPGHYTRVPEEQLTQPGKRRRSLFDGDPLLPRLTPHLRAVLAQSVEDLTEPDEWQELGAAVYLDRPFGAGKGPVSPDATPLLASLAFSELVAQSRLQLLVRDLGLSPELLEMERSALAGVSLLDIGPPVRQGTVSLADAARVASDFVYRRTLPSSVAVLFGLFDLMPLPGLLVENTHLLARSSQGPATVIYDANYQPIAEVTPLLDSGYITRRGVEIPADGVRITHTDGTVILRPQQ